MADISINGSTIGNALQQLLATPDILPGDQPSYEACKAIYLYHPIGAKLVDKPIDIAQSQARKISVPNSPEERIREAFEKDWVAIRADAHIKNTKRLSRIYGIASIAIMVDGDDPKEPVDFSSLWKKQISFNVFDPLNTAGSLVLNQNPNAMDFQHVSDIRVGSKTFHRSRSTTIMNEDPVYIAYTSSAFGFVGRSVYQRTLFPLKSFVKSMVTDDMVVTKAGVLIAKVKQAGSIVDNIQQRLFGTKRNIVKEAKTYNVISIDPTEAIETLNLQNLDGAFLAARRDILENIATGAGMPAKLLTQETFAAGFGEGTEDAKSIAEWVDGFRVDMKVQYDFFDKIVQYRAWNPEFYKTIQHDFPDSYAGKTYEQAFYEWTNSFASEWPSLLKEPDSELVKVDDVKLRAVIAAVEILLPAIDPENKARVVAWLCDSFNELKMLFGNPLHLDLDALAAYVPPQPLDEPHEPAPFSSHDSERPGMRGYQRAIESLERQPNMRDILRLVEAVGRR